MNKSVGGLGQVTALCIHVCIIQVRIGDFQVPF